MTENKREELAREIDKLYQSVYNLHNIEQQDEIGDILKGIKKIKNYVKPIDNKGVVLQEITAVFQYKCPNCDMIETVFSDIDNSIHFNDDIQCYSCLEYFEIVEYER